MFSRMRLIDNSTFDPVIDLVPQSINQHPLAQDNILLPAQFYEVVSKGCDTLDATCM